VVVVVCLVDLECGYCNVMFGSMLIQRWDLLLSVECFYNALFFVGNMYVNGNGRCVLVVMLLTLVLCFWGT